MHSAAVSCMHNICWEDVVQSDETKTKLLGCHNAQHVGRTNVSAHHPKNTRAAGTFQQDTQPGKLSAGFRERNKADPANQLTGIKLKISEKN